MALIQTVHLSMANFKSAPVVPAVQNDTDRQVKMIIDDYTLTSGLTGKIAFERSDGTHYETAAELVLTDNAFVADIDQALTQPGRTIVQLKVTDTMTVSTFSFVIFVEADNSGTVTPQEGIDLVTAVEAAEDAADRAESAASEVEDLAYLPSTIAPAFSTSVAYAVGDYVMYNGHLYRFAANHSAGAWNVGEVSEITVGSEFVKFYDNTENVMPIVSAFAKGAENIDFATATGTWSESQKRVGNRTIFYANNDVVLNVKNSCRFIVFYFSNTGVYQSNSGWKYTEYVIPAGSYFSIEMSRGNANNDSPLYIVDYLYELSLPKALKYFRSVADEVNGGIELGNFTSLLRSAFLYEYQLLSLTTVSNKYIATDGTEASNTGSYYAEVSVQGGQHYKIKSRHGSSMKMYVLEDGNGNVIDYYPTNQVSTLTETKEINIPVDGTLYVNTYNLSVLEVSLATGVRASESDIIADWHLFGDSWSEQQSGMKKWCDYTAEALGLNLSNFAVSGTGYKHGTNYFGKKINDDLQTNYDGILTIFGSGNDCQYMSEYAGTSADIYDPTEGTGDTVGGRINYAFSVIKSKAPLAKVMIISPAPWEIYPLTNTTNSMASYTELLKECTLKAGFIFVDMYHNSGLRPWDDTQASFWQEQSPSNRVHLNNDGHYFFYPQMAAEIRKIIPTLTQYVAT